MRKSYDALYALTRHALGEDPTSGHLFAVVLRIRRDRALAEDVLQEVYVNVWGAARSFDAAPAVSILK